MSPKSFQEKDRKRWAKITVKLPNFWGKTYSMDVSWLWDNQNTVQEMTVGDIIPELDYNETQPWQIQIKSRVLRSYMNEKQLDEKEPTFFTWY